MKKKPRRNNPVEKKILEKQLNWVEKAHQEKFIRHCTYVKSKRQIEDGLKKLEH